MANPVPSSSAHKGHFGEQTAVIGGKPLMFVLAILGLGGLSVGVLGLGMHQGWWTVGSLSQTDAAIMMGAGGGGGLLSFALACVGSVKEYQLGRQYQLVLNEARLKELLDDSKHTFVPQKNGKFSLVARSGDAIQILESDVEADLASGNNFQHKIDLFAKHSLTSMKECQCMFYPDEIETLNHNFGQLGRPDLREKILEIINSDAFKHDPRGYYATRKDILKEDYTIVRVDLEKLAIWNIAENGIVKKVAGLI
jgi:hypothetical protein